MAKTYLNTVKYQIVVTFKIQGIVDKHDIIGAVFGQSEGLIGEEMDLRELQKGGKIGRIEIEHTVKSGNTEGTLTIPSSMDTVQTSLLAAAVEAVDKVGPCESEFHTIKIDDVRSEKRNQIKKRAEELLKKLSAAMPETKELTAEIRGNRKSSEVILWGPDKLAAGPEVEESNEIIIVEGRADVLTLLKNNIANAISMGGTRIPKSLIDLCYRKTVIVFIDGDRGGELNLRKLANLAKVDFYMKAPDGKEVEELTRKEIEASMKKKSPFEDFRGTTYSSHKSFSRDSSRSPRGSYDSRGSRGSYGSGSYSRTGSRISSHGTSRSYGSSRGFGRPSTHVRGRLPAYGVSKSYDRREEKKDLPVEVTANPKEIAAYEPVMKTVRDSLKAKLLDKDNKEISKISVRDLMKNIKDSKNVNAVVFDGIITKRLVDAAEAANIKYLVGIKKGKIAESEKVRAITL